MTSRLNKNKLIPALLIFLAFFSMACGLVSTVANGVANKVGNAVLGQGDAGTVTTLWTDVPKMDGLTQENLDLPLVAKIAIQGFMKASMGGNGSINFISFTTAQTPQDVTNFYTTDKMTAAGWNGQDQPGCTGVDTSSATSGGGACFFDKTDANNKSVLLGIFIGQDSTTKKTEVFFMRVEAIEATPTPGQ